MKKSLLLLLASAMMLSGCGETGPQGPKGDPGEQGLPGLNGKDGKDGADGQNGSNGKDGQDGIGIISISKASTVENVDTYVILYSDNHTESFTVTNGLNGKDGETGSQGIQGVPGADGHTPVVTVSDDGYWVIDDVKTSTLAQGPKGADGVSITSIDKTSTSGLVDTYTITYSNGDTSTFTVTNGAQGTQGIQGEKGADGVTPTISINQSNHWVINGTDTGINATGLQGLKGDTGNDGKGIVSITLSDSKDGVDKYVILYSDDTTSSFTVTNGKDGTTGAQGPQGIQGVPGENGHTPVVTISDDGYWVIDDVKSSTLAQGPQGNAGKDGSSLLTGNGIPSNVLGSNNDSYIDLSTWNYYVKSEGSWTLKGNIKGESVEMEKAEYTVTFNTNGGSEIEAQVVKDGGKITPPENPTKEGYIFLNWTLPSGFVISNTEGLSFWDFYCVTSDVEITANWKSEVFNLNVSSNLESAGTFNYNDKTGVASLNESVLTGSSVSVTAVANTGYKFINWTVDGVEVSTDSTYTFSMNLNNVNLVANFERLKYHVTISNVYEFCNASEAGKASGEGDYYPGTSVTVKVTSDPLVTFVGWYNGSTKISSEKSYTFTMPNSNYTITAKWSLL